MSIVADTTSLFGLESFLELKECCFMKVLKIQTDNQMSS